MHDPDCIFCKIVAGRIPCRKAHEDGDVMAFHDIQPQAPVHVLVIPKTLFPRISEVPADKQALLGHLLLTASALAKKLQLSKGYRIVINNGPDGGESVPHLHVHLLGGRALGWPPG